MNKKLPYEDAFEQQMSNLPSPHEDESWQKMKKLLDENDKRKPFAILRSYKVFIIFFLLLLTGVWFIIQPVKTIKEKHLTGSEKIIITEQKKLTDNRAKQIHQPDIKRSTSVNTTTKPGNNIHQNSSKTSSIALTSKTVSSKKTYSGTGKGIQSRVEKSAEKNNRSSQNDITPGKQTTITKAQITATKKERTPTENKPVILAEPSASLKNVEIEDFSANKQTDQQNPATQTDQHKDTLAHKEIAETAPSAVVEKNHLSRNKKYFVSTGIGVQQQVPLAGQKVVSYGYNGTKSTFSDYIPSLYFRLERDQQWFLQAEFIYAAPQLVKEFSYNRQTFADNPAGTITTTNLRLKKTFYSEVPINFNYYIRHNWSAGIGGVYSWFHGAIAEKEIMTNHVQSQSQSVVKQIVPITGYTDSFLYKSHMYLLLQTDYNWRRFSLGLRYTRDVQPYIKYTLPDGTIKDDKNWSLEFILRFRLLKSAKFSIK